MAKWVVSTCLPHKRSNSATRVSQTQLAVIRAIGKFCSVVGQSIHHDHCDKLLVETYQLVREFMANLIIGAVITGILTGGVYALMSSGLTLIFGVMEIINIAQGALVILGAYLSYWLQANYHVDILIGLLITMPIMFILGLLIEVAFISCCIVRNLVTVYVPQCKIARQRNSSVLTLREYRRLLLG